MRQFRIVTVVNSPDLGEVLGDLQERGCEVQACNVIEHGKKVERTATVINQSKILLTDADDIHSVAVENYPTAAGAVMRTLAELPEDTQFTAQTIVDILVKQGFNKFTIKRAFFAAVHHSRFRRMSKSVYVVADTTKPISGRPPKWRRRLPKGFSQNAREFLMEYLKGQLPDKDFSRKELMKLGEKNGYNYNSMNTGVQALYDRGFLQRVNMGVYRNKIHAPVPPPIRQTKKEIKEELNHAV